MDRYNRKNSLKAFKTKVITKLFGQAEEEEFKDHQGSDSSEEDIIAPSSLPYSSDHGQEKHMHDIAACGVHRCPVQEKCLTSTNICDVGSSAQITDSEESERDISTRKRRRRGRRGHSKSVKTEQNSTIPSICNTQTGRSSCHLNDILPLTYANLTTNQKRKLKKKRKKKEKRTQGSNSVASTCDSSEPATGLR